MKIFEEMLSNQCIESNCIVVRIRNDYKSFSYIRTLEAMAVHAPETVIRSLVKRESIRASFGYKNSKSHEAPHEIF